MMVWLITLSVVVVGLTLVIWRAARGPAHTLSTLEIPIQDLLKRGYHNGFLIISINHTERFLQLKKYIYNSGNYGVKLSFPNAKWAKTLFVKLTNYCKESAIDYSIGKEAAEEPLEFLQIDFGKDAKKAHSIVVDIFLNIFEIDENTKFFVRLENASINDELIGA